MVVDDDPLTAARRRAMLLGDLAEQRVASELVAMGWTILARRYRAAGAEVDLVAILGGRLRFIEVKARVDASVDAIESITADKRRRLVVGAEAWLDAHAVHADELALMVVVVDCTVEPWVMTWIDDAFDGG